MGMALFAGEPAGVQIKKWLVILVLLIVVINVLAAGSLIVLQRSVTDIQRRYQPMLLAAGEVTAQVFQARCQAGVASASSCDSVLTCRSLSLTVT